MALGLTLLTLWMVAVREFFGSPNSKHTKQKNIEVLQEVLFVRPASWYELT